MSLVHTSSGKTFRADPGESLLGAALRADVAMAYSCRTGRCSSCRSRVSAGRTIALHDELGLSAQERDAGWILTCVRTAETDVRLEIEDLGNIHLPQARTVPCRIQSLDRLAPDVLKVMLRLPPTTAFDFLPGQYVDVIGHGGIRRSYSIANLPGPEKQLELHIREVPGGTMSAYWFGQAKPNDLLRLHGPLGTFFLREIDGVDIVFLATGTGIAPVKAMLDDLARDARADGARARSISVLWGGRIPHDLYWDVAAHPSAPVFTPVLSRADSGWTGTRGHVQQALLGQPHDWSRTVVYACGSEAMIHGARHELLAAGLAEHHFHSDAFVCSASA